MRTRFLRIVAKCRWCRDLYDALTPWVQIAGFLILCAFTVGSAWAQFNGQQAAIEKLNRVTENTTIRVGTLENNYSRIDQKLDDIKDTLQFRRH